jgi:DNA-binding Xre family transcriptional regulator
MTARTEFKKNLKKLIKKKGYKSNQALADKVGMTANKIQRLSCTAKKSANQKIDLNDADKIATALGTTLGYMCGNKYTDYMLAQTRMMSDYFKQRKKVRMHLENALEVALQEDRIDEYLDEILSNVDSLHRK